jgi:hypothetical protein
MARPASRPLAFDKVWGDTAVQVLSDRYATQIFGLAMGAVFAAMLILSAASY